MIRTGRMRTIPTLLVLVFAGCTKGMADPKNELRAASALFGEFETVFHSKADLASGSGPYKQLLKQDADTLRVPFADLLGGLDSLGKPASAEILRSGEAVLVGAKDFRPPTGLGSVQSQFCYIIVLGTQGAPDLRKYFSGFPAGSASGNPVWQWSAPPQEGHPTPYAFYVAQISGSYVLVSNNLDELQTVASRLISSEKSTPTLTDVRDWKLISQHDYWGYRRYRHSGVVNKDAAGVSDVTPSAEALIFFADPIQKTGVLRLLDADGGSRGKLNAAMSKAKAPLPPLRPSGEGAWEAMIPFAGDQETGERMFDVMGLFGFAVYL